MSDKQLLEQIGKLMVTNNEQLLLAVDEKIKESAEQLKKELLLAIDTSQRDTIDALTDLMNTGYTNHEERIERVEEKLDLPPFKHSS